MASAGEYGLSSAIVAPVAATLQLLGFDVPRRLPTLHRDLASAFVPGPVVDRLFDLAALTLGRPALGLEVGGMLPLGALGLLDYALCTSASVREALIRCAGFYGFASQRTTLRLEETPPSAALIFERRPGVTQSRHWMEFSFAAFYHRMRNTSGRAVRCQRVEFSHQAPEDLAPFRKLFGRAAGFGCAVDRLVFASSILDVPLRTAATSLARLLDDHMRALAPALAVEHAGVTRVRHALLALLAQGEARLAAVAARLHVSARTLQRELLRHGTSHKVLLDEMRRERALELLRDGVTVAEVSTQLAFSEPSAFFRAFRRWTGTSPTSYRSTGARRP